MSIQRTLQKCMEDWKQISGLDFCLLQENNSVFVTTCQKRLPAQSKLDNFRNDQALCVANSTCCLYKIMNKDELLYILIVWGTGDSVSTIGELAVCQIQSLLEAYSEKNDKNTFMQKLLLGSYTEVEAFNRARKLHISPSCKRAVFLVETRQTGDEHALTMVRNIFSARTHDFITAIDDNGIIIVRELVSTETYENLESTAHMLVDMLGAEAMTQAWVSYSNVAGSLQELANAYKEARTALEIGKIFYSERNVFGYRNLGIGRLIYQLPEEICEMFIEEIFAGESLEAIDGETLNIIRTFFENNLNLSETSRQLYVHRNTLVYRFEKIQKKFGLDLRSFEDALTFKIAMLVSGYLRYRSKS
nr:helix-turn-helix domain-containing protein [uncultured Blautia sp.]